MTEAERQIESRDEQKERIRKKYKGINADELDVILAKPPDSLYEESKERRVAVYARVSTGDPRQTSSYELQKNHYLDVVDRHPGWKLVEIYADEGISGTSLQHRDEFVRMIRDCERGKIDLIVTKSVSRFARNVLDCIGYVRQLGEMKPPVGVLFETEGIYTLDHRSEMQLSFMATTAQEESHNKSEIMNASIEMRFRRGIFLTPKLLGYDLDSEGNLVVNEEEAKTVRLIFFMYLYGYSTQQIADTLEKYGRPTKKGRIEWSPNTVLGVLQNERHCGDVLARKTWTPNYLNHKSKKNRQDRNQYRQKNHHEAIISRDDFIAVQKMIANAKYGNKGILPELHVIATGALRGFVSVHPRWAGFSVKDYHKASESVYDPQLRLPDEPQNIVVDEGSFDLRGYEIARSQFITTQNQLTCTMGIQELKFGIHGIRKMDNVEYVELLIHPTEKVFIDESLNGSTQIIVRDFVKLAAENDIHGMEPEGPLEIFFGIHIAIIDVTSMILLRVHTVDRYIGVVAERNIKTSISHDDTLLALMCLSAALPRHGRIAVIVLRDNQIVEFCEHSIIQIVRVEFFIDEVDDDIGCFRQCDKVD